MKISLELNLVDDGRKFLNFWNYMNGDDFVVEVKDGKLYNDDEEVSIGDFLDIVEDKYKNSKI